MTTPERTTSDSNRERRDEMKRRKLERIIAGRRREPMDYLVTGAVLLACISLLVDVLGGKESVSPMRVSGVALAVAILATRQLMESARANRQSRALKEYLDLRLDELESAGRKGDLAGKSGSGERK
jgi:Flp pilus assembly protein TadB